MEANGAGEGLEDDLATVVSSRGLVTWVPAQSVAQNPGRDAMAAAAAQNGWVPAEAAVLTGWIPAPGMLVMDGEDASMGKHALYLVFLCLPAQEIARCRRVCRVWRDITSTEAFRRHHRDHRYRTPMPLFYFLDPTLVRLNVRAVDIRDRVSRPIIRYTRPSNHEVLRIHGSCAGILLLSSGRRLYAFNPCTRRWAGLPPLHVDNDIIGFYTIGQEDLECHVLYHDRKESDCKYWLFTLGAAEDATTRISRPGPDKLGLDLVLANGIVPSYKIPPVFFRKILHWLPKAAQYNSNVIMFSPVAKSFSLIPPPSIQVGGEGVPVVGRQLFEINEQLAMTVVSPARVDVWVLRAELWSHRYSISVPMDAIKLNDSCHHNGSVFAVGPVAHDRNNLVQCPRILLQCDALGAVLESYQLAGHWISLSGHTIEESLLLHPSILRMRDTDAVNGDPPFFRISIIFPW